MAERLPVAIAGAGLMGYWHGYYARRSGGRVEAVIDPNRQAAEALARRHPSARIFSELGQALASARPQVVHVCAPSGQHAALSLQCLQQGAHVVVEKPAFQKAAQARRVLEAARRRSRTLVAVHQLPFQKGVRDVRRRLASAGALLQARFSLCTAGGEGLDPARRRHMLAETLPHPVSVLAALLGSEACQADWNVAACQAGLLELSSDVKGVRASIHLLAKGRPRRHEMLLTAERASFHIDFYHGFALRLGGSATRASKAAAPFRLSAALAARAAANLASRALRREWAFPGLHELIRRSYRSFAKGLQPPVCYEQVVSAARLIEQVTGSAGPVQVGKGEAG